MTRYRPLLAALLATLTLPASAETDSTREACNKWLETGAQPAGITRDDCNFTTTAPPGSILRGGTSDKTVIWREQAYHQKRFVIDTGSEQKEQPK